MARLRYNGLEAYLGATLTAAATTITFRAKLRHAGGDVPTLGAGDTITLAILGANGVPVEIVTVTAYTTGASTATVTRAQEGTTAVEHLVGRRVVHNATAVDFRAAAIPYTPTGTVAATNVQAAIDEVDAEKIPLTQKAAANGVATLDAGVLLPEAQVPTRLTAAQLSATYGAAATHLAAGTLAARPAANTVPAGTLYPATDTDIIYRSDGTSWATWRGVSEAALVPPPNFYFTAASTGVDVATHGANFLVASPVIVSDSFTVDRIGIRVTVAAAGSVIRLGIYANDGNGLPGALVVDAGTVDSTTTGVKEIVIGVPLNPGVYWVVAVNQGGTPQTNAHALIPGIAGASALAVSTTPINDALYASGVSGVLPSTFTLAGSTYPAPRVFLRRAI